MSVIKPRPAIERLQPDRPPSEQRSGKICLDMNENTRGTAPRVIRRLRRALSAKDFGAYPEYTRAREEIARHFEVSPDELLLTNGVDDAIKLIADTFVDPGDTLLIPALTFPMYQFFHSVAGGKTMVVRQNQNLDVSLEPMLAALRHPPGRQPIRWLALANPNNPTGTITAKDDLKAILRSVPRTLVLVDEAYFDYSGETVLPWIRRLRNLVVARTFSKAYGMAGLRLGLLFACRDLTRWMRRAQAVFPVNSVALAAALEAIRNPEGTRKHVDEVLQNRELLCRYLDSLGLPYVPSAANFVFASFGPKAPEIAARLAAQGILIRHWSGVPHLRPYFRIGIGTTTETRRLIRALRGLRELIEPQDAKSVWRGVMKYSPIAH